MKYGQEIATLIHHFQHWIKLNRRKQSQKHLRDGKWWTYQTREDIQNFLPYMDMQKIRYLTDQMVDKNILIKGNYNKSPIDKTLWYAFVNEDEFLGTEDSNNVYESGKPQSTAVNRNPCAENRKAIPDPKSSDTQSTDILTSGEESEERIEIQSPASKKPLSRKKINLPKEEKAPHVLLNEEEVQSLLRKTGNDPVKVEKCYQKLSEWKIAHPDYNPKSDYLAILKWVLESIQEERIKPKNEDLNKIIQEEFPRYVGERIILGYNYIEFPWLYEGHYMHEDSAFIDKVLNALRKMELPIEKIRQRLMQKIA